MLWLILGALCFAYAARFVGGFLRHRALARDTGLPYTVFPFAENNIVYLTFLQTQLAVRLLEAVPTWVAEYVYGSAYKYRWTAKGRLRNRFGSLYTVASPAKVTLQVSDASVASEICMARHSFPKPVQQYGKLRTLTVDWPWADRDV